MVYNCYIGTSMTSPILFHLSYAIELDPQGHYVFYLGVREFVYNNKIYKDRYEGNKNKRNRSNLNSNISVHRLGYLPKHRKSKYMVYRQGQNFDILPHKFCMTNKISLNESIKEDFIKTEEVVTTYALAYKYRSQDDPYYKNAMFINAQVKEVYDYENNTSTDLPRMNKNVFSLLHKHIPFEDKNLYRFLLSSRIRNSLDSKNLNRELILDMYTMMDGYDDNDFRCLLQEKLLNVYHLPAVSWDTMYKHELTEIQKQLRTQEFPIQFFFQSSYLFENRKDTLLELKEKKISKERIAEERRNKK